MSVSEDFVGRTGRRRAGGGGRSGYITKKY